MNHPLPNDDGSLERKFVVSQIAKLRHEWQESAGEGVDLNDIQGSVGMILDDITHFLGLTTLDIRVAMYQWD
jgi:hypothetical protein